MPNVFEASMRPRAGDPVFQAMVTAASSTADGVYDLHVLPLFNPPELEGDAPVLVILTGLMTPQSRGWVRLRSADPHDAPRIDLGLFTNAADMPRMLEAMRLARRVAGTEPLRGMLGDELMPGVGANDDDALAAAVRAGCEIYHHPVGTCRMGAADDPDAVVDVRGAVHGVRGLFVIDASIMPSIPAANTNVPTIMVAERCSAWLRGET
jgi:choline dehydrogenase